MDKEEARPRAGIKSATAFRTISEVSDELDVPQHVLRFWETKFPQVRPLKRGGGRRYYRPEDVTLLRNIRRLLYSEGYTIKGVQRLLKESRSIADGDTEGLASDLDVDLEGTDPTSAHEETLVEDEPEHLAPSPPVAAPVAAALSLVLATEPSVPSRTPSSVPAPPPPPLPLPPVVAESLPVWHRRQLVALRAELIELKALLNKTRIDRM